MPLELDLATLSWVSAGGCHAQVEVSAMYPIGFGAGAPRLVAQPWVVWERFLKRPYSSR